jgi:hypothetical protein
VTARRAGHLWGRRALVAFLLLSLWIADRYHLGQAADRSLAAAGYGERSTRANLWPRYCSILSLETVFLGQGPRAPEAQGHICTSHFRATEIHRVPVSRSIGIDWH